MKNLLAILFFIPTIMVWGQDTTYFYESDYDWYKEKPIEPTSYKIAYIDSVYGNKAFVATYFASGKIQSEEYYFNYKRHILDGKLKEWYENGQIHREVDYKIGKLHGKYLVYWEDGSPKRIDNYKKDRLINGKCLNADGEEVTHYEYEKYPEFPGGIHAFYQFLREEIKYPKEAKEKGIEGKVLIRFVINKDGTVSDIKIKKSSGNDLLDKEAIRVTKKMPNWKPGIIDGEVVKSWYILPIEFRFN